MFCFFFVVVFLLFFLFVFFVVVVVVVFVGLSASQHIKLTKIPLIIELYLFYSLRHYFGIIHYDGPIYIDQTWFNGFETTDKYIGGALGFQPHKTFGEAFSSNATDIRFGFVDKVNHWKFFCLQVQRITSLKFFYTVIDLDIMIFIF